MEILLFGVIGFLIFLLIYVYMYFKDKLEKQTRYFEYMSQEAKMIEKNQNALLANMSDNIYTLTQNLLKDNNTDTTHTIESEILNSANNLRELLKIKSNKVEVFNEKFSFSHMLDDIAFYLSSNFKERETEVIFDIDENVPRYLTGDVVHVSRILNNILEYTIQATLKGKVRLTISCSEHIGTEVILDVQISDTSRGIEASKLPDIFNFVYDEESNAHRGLRLYIAKELSNAINGTLEVSSIENRGNNFSFRTPMEINNDSHNPFNLKKEDKKVIIYSSRLETGLSLQKLFSTFYTDVMLLGDIELEERGINFILYDLMILDDNFFNPSRNQAIEVVKSKKKINIVAFHSLFSIKKEFNNPLIDKYLTTPSNLERVVDVMAYLENGKSELPAMSAVKREEKEEISEQLKVHKEVVEETPNITINNFKDFKGAKLLIVEDNLINQKILVGVIRNAGIEIEIANNGQEALDILMIEKKQFDIVLMDISMPVMDGLTATQKIRQNDAFIQLPVITFTAFAMGDEIEQMFEAGVNAYLTKPLNVKKLYTVFRMFLGDTPRIAFLRKSINIDGLDIEHGIVATDNSEALYKETLKEFVIAYADMINSVPQWIEAKEYSNVKASCRDMQGILDMIGAYEMKKLVDEMEKNAFSSDTILMERYMTLYPKLLTKLINAIQHYLARP